MKRTENRRLLFRLLAAFLAFYLVTMAFVTAVQYHMAADSVMEALSVELLRTTEALRTVLAVPTGQKPLGIGSLEDNPPYWDPRMRKVSALEALDVAGRGLVGVYAKSQLYMDRSVWLESGNHLFIWPFRALEGMRRYIDLDACLTPGQIADLSFLKDQFQLKDRYGVGILPAGNDTDSGTWHAFDIYGWMEEDGIQAFPKSISITALTQEQAAVWENLMDRFPPREKIVREYNFQEEKPEMDGLEPFHYWNPTSVRLETAVKPWNNGYFMKLEVNDTSQRRYAQCDAVGTGWTVGTNEYSLVYDWDEDVSGLQSRFSALHLEVLGKRGFVVDGQQYYLKMKVLCYPLEIVLPVLLPVYCFSLLLVFLLSWMLYRMLTRLWAKERELEENRRALTNAMAHDLKTPLGIIRAYSEGLREKIAEEKRDHYLEVIVDETARMDGMLRELLDFSKLESGAGIVLGECNVAALLQKCAARYEPPEAEKLLLCCDRELVIQADEARMEQVFVNLLSNALRHTPEGGSVLVTLTEKSVTVENDGEPIPEEKLGQVWDAFYQVDAARNQEGNGLGLAIVAKILDLHHFTYGVKNTRRGVLFWVGFHKRRKAK